MFNNFKKLTFTRLYSINLSNKSPQQSPVKMKFESSNLQLCKKKKKKKKKKMRQVIFMDISRELLLTTGKCLKLNC